MNSIVFHLVSCLIFLAISESSATEQLTKSNFEEKIKGRNGMVKYYQTWCGHCTRMAPDWDRVSKEVHSSVFIYDVNCGDEAELCEENGVTGYPHIVHYKDGVETRYEGGRSYDDLLKFSKENLEMACDIAELKVTCNEKEQGFAAKWLNKDMFDAQKEKLRLEGLLEKDMKPELKSWVKGRINLLQQITVKKESTEL